MISKQHSIMCTIFVNISELNRISIWLYSVSKHLNAGSVDFQTETTNCPSIPRLGWSPSSTTTSTSSFRPLQLLALKSLEDELRSHPPFAEMITIVTYWSDVFFHDNDVNPIVEMTHGWCSPVLLHCWSLFSIVFGLLALPHVNKTSSQHLNVVHLHGSVVLRRAKTAWALTHADTICPLVNKMQCWSGLIPSITKIAKSQDKNKLHRIISTCAQKQMLLGMDTHTWSD